MPALRPDSRTLQAIAAISGALVAGAAGGSTAIDYFRPSVSKPMHIATRDALTSALIEKHREMERQGEEIERLQTELERCHGGGR